MKFARSSYYYKGSGKDMMREEPLLEKIEEIALEFPRYGYRRMTHELRRRGITANHKRVIRIMREKGLLIKRKRRFRHTTDSNHPYPIYPNLIRGLEIMRLNQVWVADITYVGISNRFVYLSAILDAYSRKAIGYALSTTIDTNLTLLALRMAISRRGQTVGTIHHSDRGVQYACAEYINELTSHSFLISMSRKGNPYDNATMESFNKTLKYEEVYLWEYQTLQDAQSRIEYFIEEVYNQKRLHSSLGYRPPNEYEELILNGNKELSNV